ncbi:MAG: N-acetyl-alpha-D-glucosaminyl L-malate synthase BshA [Acidobacteria bacterium]|nr:MAG: N-acetyl-alpha-D-glucosaminyl L-malate synthase BshA [Acidobacteriota bacterium]
MKIGITCYPTYGGSGIVATELGKELAERGHEIHFISYAPPMRLVKPGPRIHFHEVEVTTYPLFDHAPYTLALATKMAEVAQSQDLDLLHCHYAIPHSVSAFLAKSMLNPRKLPVVTTLHGTDITLVGSDRSYLPITKFSIEQSDGVTAVSQPAGRGDLRKRFAPSGEKVLIHLSNFRPVKRPTDVIEIFARVQRGLPAVLLMVGDGPERSSAAWLAGHHGIESKVYFLGKQENVEEFFSISDVLLLPSDNESFGLVALEAMACEVPVVVSRVGGLPEVVAEGVEGFLVEPRNIDAMARRALEILGDDRLRRQMGQRARETATTRFSATEIIPQYERFYQKILSAPT